MNDTSSGSSSEHSRRPSSFSEGTGTAATAVADEEHSRLPSFLMALGEKSTREKVSLLEGEAPKDGLIIRESDNGKGVFATRNFRKGEMIIEFYGQRLTREELLSAINDGDSHYIQIGKDVYLGPSGGIDDFFNHSCEPNASVSIENGSALLIALKIIYKDTEITFDYSTTMDDDWEEMECNCKSAHCRKYVRDFKYLPRDVQKKYLQLGIVPRYIKDNCH